MTGEAGGDCVAVSVCACVRAYLRVFAIMNACVCVRACLGTCCVCVWAFVR